MLGIAALLLVLGAFYPRISKITVAGNTVDLAGMPAAVQRDSEAIIKEFNRRSAELLQAASGAGNAVPAAEASRIADLATAAAAHTQRDATQLRLAAAGATTMVARKPALTLTPDDLQALSTGKPLPAHLLKQLADQALTELTEADT
jgi:hypothetical protein